jgi:imidazolonepropionase-like amidohydrolase
MKDKGIFLVATDIPDNGGSPESKDRLQRAMKFGVKIAMGSDLWFAPEAGTTHGQAALRDFQALRDEGMPNIDVIRRATINGAKLTGWSDAVGEIAPGKIRRHRCAFRGSPGRRHIVRTRGLRYERGCGCTK